MGYVDTLKKIDKPRINEPTVVKNNMKRYVVYYAWTLLAIIVIYGVYVILQ